MSLKKLFNYISNPKFVRRVDRYLLLNQPVIWGARLHYVIYYGLLINLLLILIILSVVDSKYIDEFTNFFTIFLIIFEVPVFFFWMFRQSIFDVEKQHGQTTAFYKRSLLEIAVHALCFCIIFSPSVVAPTIAIHKVGLQVGINQSASCQNKSLWEKFESKSFPPNAKANQPDDAETRQKICSDVQAVTTRASSEKTLSILFYYGYLLTTVIIFTVCWPIFVIQKYSSWSTIAWFGLCLIVIVSITLTTFIVLSNSSIYFLGEINVGNASFPRGLSDMIATILAIFLLSFFNFIKVLRGRTYSSFSVVSFGISLLAISILLMFLLGANRNYASAYKWVLPLFIFLSLYFFFYPFYKKLLVKNLFLPREK